MGDLLQPTHLLFVLVVALLVLGPKRLPEVGRMLGRGLRDFRSAMSGEEPPERISPTAPPSTASPPQAQPVDQAPPSSSTTPPLGAHTITSVPQETSESAEVMTPPEAVTTSMGTDSAA